MWRLDLGEWRAVTVGINNMPNLARSEAAAFVRRWARDLHEDLEQDSPVGPERTPRLPHFRDSWQSTPAGHYSADVTNLAPHAEYVVRPTRPHEIRPGRGKVLAWSDGGGVHFARRVRHPGTAGNPVDDRAWERMDHGFEGFLDDLAIKIFGSVIGR